MYHREERRHVVQSRNGLVTDFRPSLFVRTAVSTKSNMYACVSNDDSFLLAFFPRHFFLVLPLLLSAGLAHSLISHHHHSYWRFNLHHHRHADTVHQPACVFSPTPSPFHATHSQPIGERDPRLKQCFQRLRARRRTKHGTTTPSNSRLTVKADHYVDWLEKSTKMHLGSRTRANTWI